MAGERGRQTGDESGRRRPLGALEGPSPEFCPAVSLSGPLRRLAHNGHILPNPSNSPFRTPPRNACHSPEVNRSTGPLGSLLWRTPISPSGRLATSTQLLLAKLRELLIQCEPEPGIAGRRPLVGLSTFLPH